MFEVKVADPLEVWREDRCVRIGLKLSRRVQIVV
jgi:hypothetical protein